MVNVIRRFQQPLMIAITILVIISMIYFFNKSSMNDRGRSGTAAIIYGKPVSQVALDRMGRQFGLAAQLDRELVSGLLGPQAQIMMMFGQLSPEMAAREFILRDYILRYESARLGVEPTVSEIEEAVLKIPRFQTNGAFDPNKFTEFKQQILIPNGMTAEQVDDVIRDGLRLKKMKRLVGRSIPPTPEQVRDSYVEQNQKVNASVIRLKLDDFKAGVQLTDDDLKKAFEERKAKLIQPEKRNAKYVVFKPDEKNPPTGPALRDALQNLAEQAQNFSVAMLEKGANFDELAKAQGLPVHESPEFSMEEPPADLGEEFARRTFALTKAEPNSDAFLGANRQEYFVEQLGNITPARPSTFEEVKPKLEEEVKNERAKKAMDDKAAEIRKKIEEALKGGKSLDDAAKEAGATVEALPPFSSRDRAALKSPDSNQIVSATHGLADKQLSEPLPTSEGVVLVYVDHHDPIDEADFEKQKPAILDRLEAQQESDMFDQWLADRVKAANVQTPRG